MYYYMWTMGHLHHYGSGCDTCDPRSIILMLIGVICMFAAIVVVPMLNAKPKWFLILINIGMWIMWFGTALGSTTSTQLSISIFLFVLVTIVSGMSIWLAIQSLSREKKK